MTPSQALVAFAVTAVLAVVWVVVGPWALLVTGGAFAVGVFVRECLAAHREMRVGRRRR